MKVSEMSKRALITFSLLFFLLSVLQVDAFEARVIGVMDGDTIEVLKDHKPLRIRLYGIDAPEHDQDFGSKSKRFTSEKVFRKMVEVKPVETDQYGRTVARVYVDGKYLNHMIVAEGLAWWYKSYAGNERDLEQAEKEARASKKGLWSHPDPVEPWKFRRQKKSTRNGF